jgi:hypothetical protein
MAELEERLAQSGPASIEAPAGCGKTTLIARSVKVSTGRQLVLTHTNAGVNALRSKMQQLEVPDNKVSVETIDGWSLKYTSAFPEMSGTSTTQPTGNDWIQVRKAVTKLLEIPNLHRIITSSYQGVYVDEYQDCNVIQHKLLASLSQMLPVRVFGDPFQGVFSFSGNLLVDWVKDVLPVFPHLDTLTTPYRWLEDNKDLGKWLFKLRECIKENKKIVFDMPVQWKKKIDPYSCTTGCNTCELCRKHPQNETAILFRGFNKDCREVARHSGMHQAIEEIECKRLMVFAARLESSLGTNKVNEYLEAFVKDCYTKWDEMKKSDLIAHCLDTANHCHDVLPILALLETIESSHIGRCFCQDLWQTALRAFRLYVEAPSEYTSLKDAAWKAREITRRSGRKLPGRLASTVLLVKGLEFDHAVIVNADELISMKQPVDPLYGAKCFYVAATRASKSLTIFSSSNMISNWR